MGAARGRIYEIPGRGILESAERKEGKHEPDAVTDQVDISWKGVNEVFL